MRKDLIKKINPYIVVKYLIDAGWTPFEQPHPTGVGWGFCGPKPAKP